MKALSRCIAFCASHALLVTLTLFGLVLSGSAFADLKSISTRALVQTGGEIAIGGFIISEADPNNPDGQQCVVVRGRGKSVAISSGKLADPYLTVKSGSTTIAENDDWQDFIYSVVLEEQNLAPGDPTDAALYLCLDPGAYTALLTAGGNPTGIGIVEIIEADYYDLSQILAVELKSDRTTVLAGDHLDFSPSPALGGNTSYNSGSHTLTISVGAGVTAARWADIFEPGKNYRIYGTVSGIDSNIQLKSGSSTFRNVGSDGMFEYKGSVPSSDLAVVSDGSNTATMVLNVRDMVQLDWNVTNATFCNTTGSDAEWDAYTITPDLNGKAQGSELFQIGVDTEQTIDYSLTCGNATQTSPPDTVSLEATTCPGAGTVDIVQWTSLLFSAGTGFEWPRPPGNYAVVKINQNTTKAIEFNTNTADLDDWYGDIANPEFGGEDGERDISISRCPGQFIDLPRQCVKNGVVSSGTVYWEIDNKQGGLSHTCKLDRGADGATYYYNIRFPSGCGDTSCLTRVQP